jgi:SAM-dependent methyltransferase
VEAGRFDFVSALSVWTHLNEEDARFYLSEVHRVLKPNGKAIITFFLLDELYEQGVDMRSPRQGRYHMTSQDRWIFDRPAYGSDAWFHPAWVRLPEVAIGVTRAGLDRLLSSSGLELVEYYPGNWKETPGPFFQDVLVFRKTVA